MKRSPRLAPPLAHALLRKVGAAIVSARLAGSREALLGGLSAETVARLPIAASPDMQVLSDLEKLNAMGAAPLETYLATALHFAGAYAEPAAVLQEALDALRAPGVPELAGPHPIRKDRSLNARTIAGVAAAIALIGGSIWYRNQAVERAVEPSPAPRAPLRIETFSVRGADAGAVRVLFEAAIAACTADAPAGSLEVALSINEGTPAGVALQPPAPRLAACLKSAVERSQWPKSSVPALGLIITATIE